MTAKLLEVPRKLTSGLATIASVMIAFFCLVAWFAAKDAILYIAPVVVYALAFFTIASGLIAVSSFAVWRGYWLSTKVAEAKRDRSMIALEVKNGKIESDRKYIQMVAEARLLGAAIRQVESGKIHPSALGDGKFSSFPARVISAQIENTMPILEAVPQELLSAIRECENILVVGGKGSGKTTLLQWLESERLQNGQTIALDSHAVPGQWAGQSIGNGRQYVSIKNAMIALVDKMDNRHKKRTTGQKYFEPVNTLIDEFTLLPGYLKQAGYDVQLYTFPMLTEGRKVEMNCLWGTHSDRAEPLGMKGMADLKECFDVLVYLKKVKGSYYAVCDFGEGKETTKYTLPGPFLSGQVGVSVTPVTNEVEPEQPDLIFVVADEEPETVKPNDAEMTAIEAFVSVRDSGNFYWKDATQLAFGSGKFGKNYTIKLKRILDKFGVDYSQQEVK